MHRHAICVTRVEVPYRQGIARIRLVQAGWFQAGRGKPTKICQSDPNERWLAEERLVEHEALF